MKTKIKTSMHAICASISSIGSTLQTRMAELGMTVRGNLGVHVHRAQRARAPGPAATPRINELLLHLCSGDRDKALLVLRWLAYPLTARNGKKLAMAVWIRGGQGAGKSLFFGSIVRSLYPRLESSTVHGSALESVFSEWLQSQRYVVVDGFVPRLHSEKAKHLITADMLTLHRKAKESLRVRNRTYFVFMSDDQGLDQAGYDPRRFIVLDPPGPLEPAFYQAVLAELNSGGAEAFADWLKFSLDMYGDDHADRGQIAGTRGIA